MPEGPELFLASLFINTISKTRLFGGPVVKSEVSTKNPDVSWNYEKYRASSVARGKELKITLIEGDADMKMAKTLDILFRFGMSGSFKFTTVTDLPKHAHLRFFTINEDPPMVLSFVDYRRFGRWEVGSDWSSNRGPDPMWEYPSFRENVMANLKSAAFNKPICEAMLNQKYFNGIGNYLRAEILYRCGVRPFDEAREVLSELKPFSHWYEAKMKQKGGDNIKEENGIVQKQQKNGVQYDFLDLCHIVPKEVINLDGGGKGYNVDPDVDEEEYAAFRDWLQCYYQDGMNNLVDHNKRTIWFSGEPGKLVPKEAASRSKVERKRKAEKNEEMNGPVKSKGKRSNKKETNSKNKKEKVIEKEIKKEVKRRATKKLLKNDSISAHPKKTSKVSGKNAAEKITENFDTTIDGKMKKKPSRRSTRVCILLLLCPTLL